MKKKRTKKKRFLKGLTGMILCFTMITGMLPVSRTIVPLYEANALSVDASGIRSLGANVIPKKLVDDSGFMSNFVTKKGVLGKNINKYPLYNVTNNFVLTSTKNIRKDTAQNINSSRLSRNVDLMHKDNDEWYSVYQWSPGEVLRDLVSKDQIDIGYFGNLYSDYHRNKRHWSQKWDNARVTISSPGKWGSMISVTSQEKNDREPQAISQVKHIHSWADMSYLEFKASSTVCTCGSSEVAQSAIWLQDTGIPYLTNSYLARYSDGSGKVSNNQGFRAGETVYIVLDFSEYIRFFDNTVKNLTLNLDAVDVDTDVKLDTPVKADLIKIGDNRMIFSFTVPETITTNSGTKQTDIYIREISKKQDWIHDKDDISGYLSGQNKDTNILSKYGKLAGSSEISDLAGNSVTLTMEGKADATVFKEKIHCDTISPDIDMIRMTGNMIHGSNSASDRPFPTGIYRRAVFAGVGDYLNFTVTFSEQLALSNQEKDHIYAKLNVLDENGKQVVLKASSIDHTHAIWLKGKGAPNRYLTSISFERFDIKSGMTPLKKDGDKIKITEIYTDNNVKMTDLVGNQVASSSLSNIQIEPRQQEYLDTLAPNVVGLPEDGTNYPIISESDWEFTIPIQIEDDNSWKETGEYVSGVTETKATFAFIVPGEDNEYSYVVNASPTKSRWVYWRQGVTSADEDTAQQYELFQLSGSSTAYIHIKLNEDQPYNFQGIGTLNGKIVVTTKDIVGNEKKQTFSIQHQVDNSKPEVSVVEKVFTVSEDGKSAELKVELGLKDQFDITSAEYYWYKEDGTADTKQPFTLNEDKKSGSISTSVTIPLDSAQVAEKGQRKIHVSAVDSSNHVTEEDKIIEYEVSKPETNYSVEKSSIEQPVAIPQVTMSRNTMYEEAKSLMLVEAEQPGTYYAFAYDQMHGFYGESSNLLNLPSTEEAESYPYKDSWYVIEGNIDETGGHFITKEKVQEQDLHKIYERIHIYGEYNLTFISSKALFFQIEDGVTPNFSFTMADSTVGTEHVVAANDIELELSIGDVTDAEGNSIKDALVYNKEEGTYPYGKIDKADMSFSIVNQSDHDDMTLGLNVIDYEKSYYVFQCLEENLKQIRIKGKLVNSENQSFRIPEGFSEYSGYYQLSIYAYDIAGNLHTVESDKYFIYPAEENVLLNGYNKVIVKGTNVIRARSESLNENTVELNVGLAELPEGWSDSLPESSDGGQMSGDHIFMFTKSGNIHSDYVESNFVMRIYSKEDTQADTNAPWIDMSEMTSLHIRPVLVSEFTKESYKSGEDYVVPLTGGDQTLVYEYRDTNGRIGKRELLLHVMTKQPECTLEAEITPTLATIRVQPTEDALARGVKYNSFYGNSQSINKESYEYRDSDTVGFYAWDQYGNMWAGDYEIIGVDGVDPYLTGTNPNFGEHAVDSQCFHFTVDVSDNSEISPEDTTFTFDADYSALLLGLTGEAREKNTQQITIRIPVNTEGDMVWQEFDSKYYGIFRTELKNVTENSFSMDIWGTFKYDAERVHDPYGEMIEYEFVVTAYDKKNNSSILRRKKEYENSKPTLQIYSRNYIPNQEQGYLEETTTCFDEDGNLMVGPMKPVKYISSYGAGQMSFDVNEFISYQYTSMPMISADGSYPITFVDLFDQTYEEDLIVSNVYSNENIQFELSEKELTNKPVIVSAKALSEGDSIVSIEGEIDGQTIQGSIDELDESTASITMPENGTVKIKTKQGFLNSIKVRNIDKTLEKAVVKFYYNGSENPTFIDESEDTVAGNVIAHVSCEEEIEGMNGTTDYTFLPGSKAGDTYVFQYRDIAGNTGEITAVLPYNVYKETLQEGQIDTEAPYVTMNVSTFKNGQFQFAANFIDPEDTQEITDYLSQNISQKYSMSFEIDDISKTKLIIRNSGNPAPTDISESSDKVDDVTVSGNKLVITNNVTFDIYIIDEAGNVKAIKNMAITSVDNEAPAVTVNYETRKNDKGLNIVRARFVPENDELIVPVTSDTGADIVSDPDTYISTLRYYKDYETNGKHNFVYQDIYGNIGSVVIDIEGIDNEIPKVHSVVYFGTVNNVEPTKSSVVNRNITADISVSKAISNVQIYKYDETAENHIGEPVDLSGDGIELSFVDKKADITFTKNTNMAYTVEIIASSSRLATYVTIPVISCIDKVAPEVTITSETLTDSKDKKTYTFTTNEPAICDTKAVYQTKHEVSFTKNGEFTVAFTDKAGNKKEQNIEVRDIDDVILELSFSKSSDGSNETSNPQDLQIEMNETFYVKTNKDADIYFDENKTSVTKDVWNKFSFEAEDGIYSIKAVDKSTGKMIYKTLALKVKDATAPVIQFDETTIYMPENSTREEITDALHKGVSIQDNEDGEITDYEISGVPVAIIRGVFHVNYTAKDKAGNERTVTRVLYIYYGNKVVVKLNGSQIAPNSVQVVEQGALRVKTELEQDEPVVTKWEKGILTTGQMKYSKNFISQEVPLYVTTSGYYTLYVRTQSRNEFVAYIYVAE